MSLEAKENPGPWRVEVRSLVNLKYPIPHSPCTGIQLHENRGPHCSAALHLLGGNHWLRVCKAGHIGLLCESASRGAGGCLVSEHHSTPWALSHVVNASSYWTVEASSFCKPQWGRHSLLRLTGFSHHIFSILFCSVLFYSIPFYSVLFCSALFCSVLFYSTLPYLVLSYPILF